MGTCSGVGMKNVDKEGTLSYQPAVKKMCLHKYYNVKYKHSLLLHHFNFGESHNLVKLPRKRKIVL
jgi:hypothetical protein